jgi:hypothetical protein
MTGADFLAAVDAHPKLEWVGCLEGRTPAGDEVLVRNGRLMAVPVSAVLASDWRNLEAVLTGREPCVLHHVTRITGYFSRVENWNRSAVAGLKDRHRGDYSLREAN